MGRSILAIAAGYAVWSVLWLGGGAAIQAAWAGAVADDGTVTALAPLLVILALSVVCSLASGATAAAVGQRRRVPVVVMALLLLATGIGVQASIWDRMPVWFHLPFLVLIVPGCLLGAGRMRGAGHPGRRA